MLQAAELSFVNSFLRMMRRIFLWDVVNLNLKSEQVVIIKPIFSENGHIKKEILQRI